MDISIVEKTLKFTKKNNRLKYPPYDNIKLSELTLRSPLNQDNLLFKDIYKNKINEKIGSIKRKRQASTISDLNGLMVKGHESLPPKSDNTKMAKEPNASKGSYREKLPKIKENAHFHLQNETPIKGSGGQIFQMRSSNLNKLIERGLFVCQLNEAQSAKKTSDSLQNYYKKSQNNRNYRIKDQKSEYFTQTSHKIIDLSNRNPHTRSRSPFKSASKGSIRKGSNVAKNRENGIRSVKTDVKSGFIPMINHNSVTTNNNDSIQEGLNSGIEESKGNLKPNTKESSAAKDRYRGTRKGTKNRKKDIVSLNQPFTPNKIYIDNGSGVDTVIHNLNSVSTRKFGSPINGPILRQDLGFISGQRYIHSKRVVEEDDLQNLLTKGRINFPPILEKQLESKVKQSMEIFPTKRGGRHRPRGAEDHQLLIKKLDTRLTNLKDVLAQDEPSERRMKSESLQISEKIKLPCKDKDCSENPSKLLKVIKFRHKGREYYQSKAEERIQKIQKASLAQSKHKEVVSRGVHQFCTDSAFNTLLRNFNDFITMTSRKANSREEANIISEASKKLGVKPLKNMFLDYYSSNELIEEVRNKVLESFLRIINKQNHVSESREDEKQDNQGKQNNGFKAFIQKGNHGTIVKTILNRRSWWSIQDSHDENYETTDFIWTQWIKQPIVESLPIEPTEDPPIRTYGKLEGNFNLSNKNSLTKNLTSYYEEAGEDATENIPLTFLVSGGSTDSSFTSFEQYFTKISENSIQENKWICKPGENSNRGQHICVLDDLKRISEYVNTGVRACYIIQKYISNPLLINKRKFDIRCFSLLTSINGQNHGFFYQDGYLRTASKEYNPDNLEDKFVHLTNDAIQKKSEDYGKYESSNKLSFQDFEKYLEQNYPNQNLDGHACFYTHIYPQIKKLVRDTFLASEGKINPKKRSNCFELFGYDFMVTDDFKVYLIEVNTNPCLETPCSLLSRIISSVLDNSFRIALDPLTYTHNNKMIFLGESNNNLSKFELVYADNQT
ncbi:unnamed protein product [Moneuplotes crassus]|uniref:Tubulin-tyrosine ligase family protein n=1 Tax=Euplotes crassus TaxID=5936 RepID=A0AAD2D2K9_EUPCR|nr:unnamed protein product [Moneuplotes crassus]